jgi:hypothetical protein
MADQVAVRLPKSRWPEKTTFTATVNFRTLSTAAASTPTTIHYRIDCLSTKTKLQDWTSVSAAAEATITITSTHNAIQDDNNNRERRQILVQADQGLSTQATGRAVWLVENYHGIS